MSRTSSYRLISCLGRGGFGEVYLAVVQRDGGLERRRALKLLRADLDRQEEAVARLRDEGRLLALLEHPAIVQVEDIVRIQGRVGLLMEHVDGVDLRWLHKQGLRMPSTVALEVLATVADALTTAVERPSPTTGRPLRLVHRDIKPGNVMLTTYGRVKLLDFGVARTREVERDTHTKAGEVPMTPGYVAPEVILHQVQEPPGDVYALGVVFFLCLTGERVFQGMKFREQVTTIVDPNVYQEFLDKRLELVQHPGLRSLCADMLSWFATDRPAAHLVRERAERLLERIPGASLARWVRQVDLPPAPDLTDAPLVGRLVLEDEGPGEFVRMPAAASLPPASSGGLASAVAPSRATPVSNHRYGATLLPLDVEQEIDPVASAAQRAANAEPDTLRPGELLPEVVPERRGLMDHGPILLAAVGLVVTVLAGLTVLGAGVIAWFW